MNKIGLLLPNSVVYSEMTLSFTDGLHLALDALPDEKRPQVYFETIGNGGKQEVILEKLQKLLVQDRVNLVIADIGHHAQEAVMAQSKANRKLLYLTGLGANLYTPIKDNPFTLVNTFQLWESAWQLGKRLGSQGKKVLMASSFYDSGYQISHAFQLGLAAGGGEVMGYKIPEQDWTREDVVDLAKKVKESGADCVHSNLSLPSSQTLLEHYPESEIREIPIYGNATAVFASETEARHMPEVSGFCTWDEAIQSNDNLSFLNAYKGEHGILPNLFSLMGYEAGLFAARCIESGVLSQKPQTGFTADLKSLATPRGLLSLRPSGHFESPQFYFSTGRDDSNGERPHKLEPLEGGGNEIAEEITNSKNQDVTGWLNCYLCR